MILKPTIYFIICFLVTTLLAALVGPVILVLSGNVFSSLQIIITVLAALSFAFFTYTDNIDQKLTDLYKKFQESKIDQAHVSIASLKKELLANAFFVVGIVILERIASAVPAEKYLLLIADFHIEGSLISLVFRVSLFLLAVLVFIDQGKAFNTAVQFRHLVSKGAWKQ
jgi:hypothetical protein